MERKVIGTQRNGHSWLMSYRQGDEDNIIEYIMKLADDSTSPFNWMDAADLALEVTGQERNTIPG